MQQDLLVKDLGLVDATILTRVKDLGVADATVLTRVKDLGFVDATKALLLHSGVGHVKLLHHGVVELEPLALVGVGQHRAPVGNPTTQDVRKGGKGTRMFSL